jgi:hypothetical protein
MTFVHDQVWSSVGQPWVDVDASDELAPWVDVDASDELAPVESMWFILTGLEFEHWPRVVSLLAFPVWKIGDDIRVIPFVIADSKASKPVFNISG